jgi:hypothetical protein
VPARVSNCGFSDRFSNLEFAEPLAKTPNFSWGIVKFSLRVVVTIVRSGPLLSRGATRGASGAAGEELTIGGEEARWCP